ncbi:MAG: DNA-3-methyladenine glycosylase I [Acidobacteriia bacterium]|nr:DNA-3-methyladenine glycosylase I [Terriglobia bacterium]
MSQPNVGPELASGLTRGHDGNARCFWGAGDWDYTTYHDHEWGVPTDKDPTLFEKICLEGFQSGLSWLTILRKRESFREAFDDFDFERVAEFTEEDVERLLGNPGIVRHRGKIRSTINNAKRARELAAETGSLASYFWSWEPSPQSRPPCLDYATLLSLTKTPESTAMSTDLKRRSWTFVGPTTAYAFMQAMGLVNDHIEGCCARPRIEHLRAAFERP